jgi:CRP-like cAMP-binding protein
MLQIRREGYSALLDKRPAIAREMLRYALSLLREANETIRRLSMFDVHDRIVRCPMKPARHRNAVDLPRVRIEPSLVDLKTRPSNRRLVEMVGSSRETVSQAMTLLGKIDFVRFTGRKLVLKAGLCGATGRPDRPERHQPCTRLNPRDRLMVVLPEPKLRSQS